MDKGGVVVVAGEDILGMFEVIFFGYVCFWLDCVDC